MKKGTVELSLETLVIILSIIAIAALLIYLVIMWALSPGLRSSNTCDFVCSLKESLFILKYMLPKISTCGC